MWLNRIISGLLAVLFCAVLVHADSINISANYAEGTWTPTYTGSTTPGTGQTYNAQVGSYEQIGRQVTLRFNIQATSLGTAAGNIQISGIPFANSATTNHNGTCVITYYSVTALAALTYGITGNISSGTSLIAINSNANGVSTSVTVGQAGGSAILIGMCNYHV